MSAWTSAIALFVREKARAFFLVGNDGTPVDRDNPIPVTGASAVVAAAALTRPNDTTPYASGDLVANSTTAGSVAALQFTVGRLAGGTGRINRARIQKSGTTVTNCALALKLYTAAPTTANGDNGAWSSTGAATLIGTIPVTVDQVLSDGAVGFGASTATIHFDLGSTATKLYGLLVATAAYTPAAEEVFTVSLEVSQD